MISTFTSDLQNDGRVSRVDNFYLTAGQVSEDLTTADVEQMSKI